MTTASIVHGSRGVDFCGSLYSVYRATIHMERLAVTPPRMVSFSFSQFGRKLAPAFPSASPFGLSPASCTGRAIRELPESRLGPVLVILRFWLICRRGAAHSFILPSVCCMKNLIIFCQKLPLNRLYESIFPS